jgi:hypothetical protein
MKYIGTLHSYICHTLLLFNPISLDEVCVQATHLKNRANRVQEDPTNKPSKFPHNQFKLPPPGTPLGKCPTHTTQRELLEGSSDTIFISDAPTHTHAKNITHTQQKGMTKGPTL